MFYIILNLVVFSVPASHNNLFQKTDKLLRKMPFSAVPSLSKLFSPCIFQLSLGLLSFQKHFSNFSIALWLTIKGSICFHVFLFGFLVRCISHLIQLKKKKKVFLKLFIIHFLCRVQSFILIYMFQFITVNR